MHPLLPFKFKGTICTLLLIVMFLHLQAQTFPEGFSRVQVASGISNPTVMAFAPDGRIFVAQQNGVLKVIKNGSLLSTSFLSLNVNSSGERGLIGIALDPNFATNQYVYVYYTLSDGSRNRISRFTGNGDVVVPNSEVVILDLDPLSSATNHNGGAMHFKGGLLYVAVGENANGSHAQNLDTYHGKILRINPDGSVPSGNPFTSGSEQKRRVWAYGLRNPYTFDIQPGTGKIFINDVGQNTWEEINDATTGGKNFGWPDAEGNSSNTSFTNPVYAYQHGSGDGKGCAITGGVFFNPATTNYPQQYIGKYFFQDLCNKWINTLDISGTPTRASFATNLGNNSLSIDVGNDGNLYYLERSTGAIYKIIYTENTAPAIVTQPSAVTVSAGQPATFSVTATGTAPLSYQWQKNGTAITGATGASYTISNTTTADAGNYRVVISNSAGSVTSNAVQLTVTTFNGAPVPEIITPVANTLYRAGDVISFSGNATDPEDGELPASAFTWFVDFHHDTHTHDGPPVASGVKSGTFTIPTSGEVSPNVWYRLFLVVEDSDGLKDTVYRDVNPRTSTITLQTQPAGLQLTLDGQPVTTPITVTSVEGIERAIGVVSPQTYQQQSYTFSEWLHGGNASQTIATPNDNVTYTAVFTTPLRAPENPSNVVNGLKYDYFEGTYTVLPDFNSLTPAESGEVEDITLSPKNREDNYAFEFNGYINIPSDGVYTFYTSSDDGSALYIGETLVVNNDGLHSTEERNGSIGLQAGKHAVTVRFFERTGSAVLQVSYSSASITKQAVPATAWYRASAFTPLVLEAESASLSGPQVVANHTGFTGTGFADYINASGDFITWTASVPAAGSYTLIFRYALASNPRSLSVKVNGTTTHNSVSFPQTATWSTWSTVSVTANLNAGSNTITATAIGSSGPNMDNLTIETSSNSARVTSTEHTLSFDDDQLDIYPNPVQNHVTVKVQAKYGDAIKVEVMSLEGKSLISNKMISKSTGVLSIPVDVTEIKSGTYLLMVNKGKQTRHRLVIINK